MLRSNYSNFISLGYFCGVAEDLERIGLRSFSSPFDWLITDFKGVIKLIENRFKILWHMRIYCRVQKREAII